MVEKESAIWMRAIYLFKASSEILLCIIFLNKGNFAVEMNKLREPEGVCVKDRGV